MERLRKAIEGKTQRDGGLNLVEFRKELIKRYPEKASLIQKKNRRELEKYSKTLVKYRSSSRTPSSRSSKGMSNGSLQARYCRCISKVAAKNPQWCYRHGAWKSTRKGDKCYNPYSICTASTKRRGAVRCGPYYRQNLLEMPSAEVRALAMMKGTSVEEYKKLLKKEK